MYCSASVTRLRKCYNECLQLRRVNTLYRYYIYLRGRLVFVLYALTALPNGRNSYAPLCFQLLHKLLPLPLRIYTS